jgi:hypothetical protein
MSAADVVDEEHGVQTSAPAATPGPRADATMAFTGHVLHKPTVAYQPDSSGASHPVVILELDRVGPAKQRLKAHVHCKSHEEANTRAASIKRGDVVDVACPLSEIRLFLGAATLSTDNKENH